MADEIVNKEFSIWAPFTKSADGSVIAILSDSSIDRENERMAPELIEQWASNVKALPALTNHKRDDFEKIVAVWTNPVLLKQGNHRALQMTPQFLSHAYAQTVKQIVEECLKFGYNTGTSIGALPKKFRDVTEGGVGIREYTTADLLEASFTPIQANPNAMTFSGIAKSFQTEKEANANNSPVLVTKPNEAIKGGIVMDTKEMETKLSELEKLVSERDKTITDLKAKQTEMTDEEKKKKEEEAKKKKEEEMKSMEQVAILEKKLGELEKKLNEPVLKGQAEQTSTVHTGKGFFRDVLGKAYGSVK